MAYDTHDRLAQERHRGGGNWEYRVYFVPIFLLIALPVALWRWTAAIFHPRGKPVNPGVMQRAITEARIITTTIFST